MAAGGQKENRIDWATLESCEISSVATGDKGLRKSER